MSSSQRPGADGTLAQLEEVGRALGVDIRYEQLESEEVGVRTDGGLCRVMDRQLILIDSRLSVEVRCKVLACALGQFDLSGVFLLPAIRRIIEAQRED